MNSQKHSLNEGDLSKTLDKKILEIIKTNSDEEQRVIKELGLEQFI